MSRDEILERYLKVCADASTDDEVFKTFKSHPHYHEVLEHCPEKIGLAHLESIRKNNPWLLVVNSFWANDKIGNPPMMSYGTVKASPTTLQYINVLSNLINLFGTLKGMRIVEIGAGYGGQAKIIQDVFDVESYDVIDLYEVTLLIQRYLDESYKMTTHTNENYEIKKWDLFISNYALTEVSPEDQLKYVQDICMNCEHGYITANQPLNGIELLRREFRALDIKPDIEGERKSNYLITW